MLKRPTFRGKFYFIGKRGTYFTFYKALNSGVSKKNVPLLPVLLFGKSLLFNHNTYPLIFPFLPFKIVYFGQLGEKFDYL